ncbi:hypothetical protein AcV7_006690 [Taiwanofungus camphoratus]|nr:hypothetical protein AcV7_006690 [Antrodia cinnamomea]
MSSIFVKTSPRRCPTSCRCSIPGASRAWSGRCTSVRLGLNICTQNPELAALQDGSLQQLIFMTIHDNPYLQVAAFLRR